VRLNQPHPAHVTPSWYGDGVFTKPWSAAVSYRRPLGEWPEMVCAENPNEYFHARRTAVPMADKPDF
jgi:hypothetical protein